MKTSKTARYARSLYNAHGDKAEWEAAQRAKDSIARGQRTEAKNWHSVRKAIREIRGARAT